MVFVRWMIVLIMGFPSMQALTLAPVCGAESANSHRTDHLVITCIDFRFQHRVNDWIEQYLGNADLVAIAGAAKCITEEESRPLLLKQVELSVKLHGVKNLVLIDHMDCGAYGGSKAFASKKIEHQSHVKELREAATTVQKKHPDLTIRLYIMDEHGIEPIESK